MPTPTQVNKFGSINVFSQYQHDVDTCTHLIKTTASQFQDIPSEQLNNLKLHYWQVYCTIMQHLSLHDSQSLNGILEEIYSLKEVTDKLLSAIEKTDDLEWLVFESKLVHSIIYITYLIKVAVPKGLWLKMHKLYHKAYHLKSNDNQGDRVFNRIESYYKQAIIMAVFDPYKLKQHEFTFVFDKLDKLTKLIHIDNNPHFSENSIAFKKDIDEPFFRYDDYNMISSSDHIYSIDLSKIKNYFNPSNWFSINTIALKLSAHKKEVALQHIQSVFNKTTSTFIRNDARENEQQACYIGTTWRYVKSTCEFYQSRTKEDKLIKAMTLNQSESGICIELDNKFAANFKPGESIYIGLSNPMQNYLGLIKWVTSCPNQKTKIGVEKISEEPLPCLFENHISSLNQKQFGLLCYNYKAEDIGIYLIMDKSVKPSQKINLWTSTDRATKHDFKLHKVIDNYYHLVVWELSLSCKKDHPPN